jgi:transposase
VDVGGIGKRGDSYLRRLFDNDARAALPRSKADPWLIALRGRGSRLIVAVALANKAARIASGEDDQNRSFTDLRRLTA